MIKNYQFRKIKNYLKNYFLVLVVNCSRVEFRNWITSEQILKQHALKYYTVQNNRLLNIIKKSIYKNFSQVLSSTILFAQNQDLKQIITFLNSLKTVETFLLPISIKVNNKMYTTEQLSSVELLKYRHTVKNFNKKLLFFSRINKNLKNSK